MYKRLTELDIEISQGVTSRSKTHFNEMWLTLRDSDSVSPSSCELKYEVSSSENIENNNEITSNLCKSPLSPLNLII